MIDASVAVRACGRDAGFAVLGDAQLVAPPLLWSECRSAIREATWRGQIDAADGVATYARLARCPVERRAPARLHAETWLVADELGWAKTYDAEYVALARILGCRLVTLDGRLKRGAERLGLVISADEL